MATWDEVRRLVGVMGDLNAGIFELAGENVDRSSKVDPAMRRDYHVRLRDLAVETGRPITFGLFSRKDAPGVYKDYVNLLDETATAGGRMFAQVHSRALSAVLSFRTQLPFDKLPVWSEIRKLPLAEQRDKYRDPGVRAQLVAAASAKYDGQARGTEAKPMPFDRIFVMESVHGTHRSVAEVARDAQHRPGRDHARPRPRVGLQRLLPDPDRQRGPGHRARADAAAARGRHLLRLRRPRLASSWTPRCRRTCWPTGSARSRPSRSSRPCGCSRWCRPPTGDSPIAGLIREGMAADLVVFDPDTIAAEMPEVVHDLPAGAKRLTQRCRGIAATVVNGEVLLRDGKHTGALPGRLLRGPLARQV